MQVSVEAEAKFWAKVNKDLGHGPKGDCWIWTGYCHRNGHGQLKITAIRKAPIYAHRLSFHLANPEKSLDCVVRHDCDFPPCVNPQHLIEGTQGDNNRDRAERGRSALGERNGGAVLTKVKVFIIKRLLKHLTAAQIARHYGVHPKTIYQIRDGETWKHVS